MERSLCNGYSLLNFSLAFTVRCQCKANGENLNNLRYADDTSLLAGSEEDLQRLLNIVVEESEKLGLSLNVKKTECMVVSKKKNNPECKLFKGEQIRQVQKFKYLGYTYIPS